MDHKRVDTLMKQVEEHYHGNFCINGNRSLSDRIAERIRKKTAKKFVGNNGNYTAERMLVTDGSAKEKDHIRLSPNGVVYGPYVDFLQGEYYAYFYLDGEVSLCTLTVEAAGCGCFASAEAKELKIVDGAYELPFTLPADVHDLELKVHNQGAETVVFERVTVSSVSLEMKRDAAMRWDTTAVDETELQQHGPILQELVEEIHDGQRISFVQIDGLMQTAECILPSNERLYNVKRILRKLMKPFTRFQIMFNHGIVRMCHQIVSQINVVMDAIVILYRSQLAHQEKIKSLEQFVADYKSGVYAQVGQLQPMGQSKRVDEVGAPCADSGMEINRLWNKIQEVDRDFQEIWQNNQLDNISLDGIRKAYNNLRQELFYELDHRIRLQSVQHVAQKSVTVIRPSAAEKITAADGKIRLNLGSGSCPVDSYINVDARDLPAVDVVADISALPYEKGSVDEIFSSHVIEHFTHPTLEKELLPYWHALLKDGGFFRVIFRDCEQMILAYQQGEMTFEQLGYNIMGAQDCDLDYHHAVYSAQIVVDILRNIGFREVQIVAHGRENGGCKETEILAKK